LIFLSSCVKVRRYQRVRGKCFLGELRLEHAPVAERPANGLYNAIDLTQEPLPVTCVRRFAPAPGRFPH
jgi:hypothetical protein